MDNIPAFRPRVVALGCDHAGFALKSVLHARLTGAGWTVLDRGATDGETGVDYPDVADAACAAVISGQARFAVLICGTGLGISIAANRHPGIRCALAGETTSARLAREHNDANALALGARIIGPVLAIDILDIFLATRFEGKRHLKRVTKLTPTYDEAVPA